MPFIFTNESKNNITLTNEPKQSSLETWDEASYTWNEATGTWDVPAVVVTNESKNTLNVTNENKN